MPNPRQRIADPIAGLEHVEFPLDLAPTRGQVSARIGDGGLSRMGSLAWSSVRDRRSGALVPVVAAVGASVALARWLRSRRRDPPPPSRRGVLNTILMSALWGALRAIPHVLLVRVAQKALRHEAGPRSSVYVYPSADGDGQFKAPPRGTLA